MTESLYDPAWDSMLLQRLRASDADAVDVLLEHVWAALVGFAYRYIGSLEVAEDIAQESFVRLWIGRAKWDAGGSPRAILYRIARNLCIDERRKQRVRHRMTVEDVQAPSEPSPMEVVEASELAERLNVALHSLGDRDREIFLLSRQQGLSHREIADVLQLAPQTVANLMQGILTRLRVELAPFMAVRPEARIFNFPRRQA